VYYDVRSFLEKNKDELLLNIRELLLSSTQPFLQMLFNEESNPTMILAAKAQESAGITRQASQGGTSGGGKGDKLSQGFQFRTQLDALMKTLNATAPHYIRCIKPNATKAPLTVDDELLANQVAYLGIVEGTRVKRAAAYQSASAARPGHTRAVKTPPPLFASRGLPWRSRLERSANPEPGRFPPSAWLPYEEPVWAGGRAMRVWATCERAR
jgi:hypothetical protein